MDHIMRPSTLPLYWDTWRSNKSENRTTLLKKIIDIKWQ